MITFYPRDIGRWRQYFDFGITLVHNPDKPRFRQFSDRNDLIQFLKHHGVRLDDPRHPLTITKYRGSHPTLGSDAYDVVQWTLLGWIKDDYTSAV